MATQPLTTGVIVPAYNAACFLEECLDSILAQTGGEGDAPLFDMQVVVVDDGSTDATPDICLRYAAGDSRVRVITQANSGLSAARNAALDALPHVDVVTFVDSDDKLLPGALETLVRAYVATGARIVCGGVIARRPASRDTGRVLTIPAHEALEKVYRQRDYFYNNVACSKLYDRALFEKIRFYAGWFEDLEIADRLYTAAGMIAYVDSNVYYYRQHPGAFSHRFSPGRLDVLGVTDAICRRLGDAPEGLLKAAMDRRFSANFHVFLLLPRDTRYDGVRRSTWKLIKDHRRSILTDGRSRRLNRMGALLSYLGPRITRFLGRLKGF